MNKTTLLLTALVSASALAQETPPPAPPPAAPAAPAAAPAPAPEPAPSVVDHPIGGDPGGRVRWGISANFGWFIPHPAFTFGGEGRIGYQISNMFSAFLIAGGTAGFGGGANANATGGSGWIIGVGYGFVGAVAELIFGDLFYVGGGPVVGFGGYGLAGVAAGTSGASVTAAAAGGAAPGLDIRLGLGFGRPHDPPSFRRGGFNLGLTGKLLFHTSTAVTRVDASMGGAGVNVTTNELTVSFTPMVTLGYDGR